MATHLVDPHATVPFGSTGIFNVQVWGRQGLEMGVGPKYFAVAPYHAVNPVESLSREQLASQFAGMKLWDRSANGFGSEPFMLKRGYPYPDHFVNGSYLDGGFPQTVPGRYLGCWNRMPASPGGGFFDRVYSPLMPPQVDGSVYWHAWNIPYGAVLQVPTQPDNPNSSFWEANAMINYFLRYTPDDSNFGTGEGWYLERWQSNTDMGDEIEPDDPGEDPTFVGWNPQRVMKYCPAVPNYERQFTLNGGPAVNHFFGIFTEDGILWAQYDPEEGPPPEANLTTTWYDPGSLQQHSSPKYFDWTRPQLWLNQLWPSTPSEIAYPVALLTVPYYP